MRSLTQNMAFLQYSGVSHGIELLCTLHESHSSTFRGSAGPKPQKMSQSLAMAELSVRGFPQLCGEGCLKLAHRFAI